MAKTLKALPIQNVFIQKLKENMPANVGLAEEISDILEISLDSAYRRIRGETDLSIDEVYKLTKKYSISMDSVFSNLSDTVTFAYTKLTDSEANFEKYLGRILAHVKSINASSGEKKIIYVAEEVPLFHSFFSRKLIEFKLFYWQRSVLNIPTYQGKKFEFGLIPDKLIGIATAALEEYRKIPSVEIWTSETILTVTKQIEFYLESGVLNKKDATEVMDEIVAMARYLEQCAETGRKEISQKEENFMLYNSEVVLGTNCIYLTMGGLNYAYITFNTLNSLTTNNHEFCDETEHWIRNLVKKSTLISGMAEKQRYQFFNKVYQNLDESMARIKSF